MYYRPVFGLTLGALYYLVQCVTYVGDGGSWGLQSGIYFKHYMAYEKGILSVNLLAIGMAFVHVWVAMNVGKRTT